VSLDITLFVESFRVSTTATPQEGVVPFAVSFSSSIEAGIPPFEYEWVFGDGSTISNEQNPSHTFIEPGLYASFLTASDASDSSLTSTPVLIEARSCSGDADGDGICDEIDDCFGDNSSGDDDMDGVCNDLDECVGDDSSGDDDADGFCNESDNCVNVANPNQGDADNDGLGDVCDSCPLNSDVSCLFENDFEGGDVEGWSSIVGDCPGDVTPENPGFDQGLSPWIGFSSNSTGWTSWTQIDANGSSDSGSARVYLKAENSAAAGIKQCVEVCPETDYRFEVQMLVPHGQPDGIRPGFILSQYSDSECTSHLSGTFYYFPESSFPNPNNEWVMHWRDFTLSSEVHSVKISLYVRNGNAEEDTEVYYDDVSMIKTD